MMRRVFTGAALVALLGSSALAQPYQAGSEVNLRSRQTGNSIGDDPTRPLYTTSAAGGGGAGTQAAPDIVGGSAGTPYTQGTGAAGANSINAYIGGATTLTTQGASTATDASGLGSRVLTGALMQLYNGSGSPTPLLREAPLAYSNQTGMAGVADVAVAGQITPTPVTGTTGATVVKASAGNVYAVNLVAGATAGYLVLNNTTAAPTGGAATTALYCMPVAANAGLSWRSDIPLRFGTGIVALFSTGCTTYTAVTPAFVSIEAQ